MLSKDLCLLLKESQSISLYSDPLSDNLKPPKSVYFLRFSKNYHHQYDHFSLLDSGFFHMVPAGSKPAGFTFSNVPL